MKSTHQFINSSLWASLSVFAWTFLWWPLGRAAHDAFFNYFHDTRVPPQFFPANPLLTVALFFVIGHALVSPIAWIILGRVFRSRAGTLAASAVFAYLAQSALLFITLEVEDLWLNEPNSSIFALWGLVIFAVVLGLNVIAAILAPLTMFVTARAANRRVENKS